MIAVDMIRQEDGPGSLGKDNFVVDDDDKVDTTETLATPSDSDASERSTNGDDLAVAALLDTTPSSLGMWTDDIGKRHNDATVATRECVEEEDKNSKSAHEKDAEDEEGSGKRADADSQDSQQEDCLEIEEEEPEPKPVGTRQRRPSFKEFIDARLTTFSKNLGTLNQEVGQQGAVVQDFAGERITTFSKNMGTLSVEAKETFAGSKQRQTKQRRHSFQGFVDDRFHTFTRNLGIISTEAQQQGSSVTGFVDDRLHTFSKNLGTISMEAQQRFEYKQLHDSAAPCQQGAAAASTVSAQRSTDSNRKKKQQRHSIQGFVGERLHTLSNNVGFINSEVTTLNGFMDGRLGLFSKNLQVIGEGVECFKEDRVDTFTRNIQRIKTMCFGGEDGKK